MTTWLEYGGKRSWKKHVCEVGRLSYGCRGNKQPLKKEAQRRKETGMKEASAGLTRSTFMIWNLWEMSAVLAGSLERPETKRMKRTRSSLENSSRVCQNHCTSECCSSTSR